MLAHHFQLESHFAIPIQVLCWRSNSLARDTIHVPLQIQLIFIMLQLALHHLHKIQFPFSPNSNSNFPSSNSCWRHVLSNSNCSSSYRRASHRSRRQFVFPSNSRYSSRFPPIHGASALAGSSLRYNTRFPPIRTFLPRINPGAPARARDTFCAHFQLQLIMLAHQLQLKKAIRVSLNSNFPSWNSCQRTNFDTRYNSHFSAIRVSPKFAFPPNLRHLCTSFNSRKQFTFLSKSTSDSSC
jgi:hypothetical protein